MGKVYKALNKALGDQEVKTSPKPVNEEMLAERDMETTVSIPVEQEKSTPFPAQEPPLEPQPTQKQTEIQSTAPKAKATEPSLGEQNLFNEETTKETTIEDWDERLIHVTTSSPLVTEGIRRLRNKILHPGSDRKIKSILVTSALPNEGKSFICANLGINMAQGIDTHALIVDCDLRRPSMADLFGTPNNKGLVDHLTANTDLSRLIRKTGQDKLSLLTSGPPPVNPAEVLGSERMTTLIDEMVERYKDRLIIFDSPPMQAAAETAVLAKHVDAVLVVVRWGYASRDLVQQLVEAIGKEKVLGVVFNAFQVNSVEKKLQKMKGYEGYYKYAKDY